jgi:hypothetical protein
MAARNYSNVAVDTELTSGINNTDTSLTVDSASGWPAAPFALVIEPGTANEELILVGAKASNVFSSLTRGYGGSTGVSHSAGSDIKHVYVAEDARLAYTHVHSGSSDHTQVDHGNLSGLGDNDHPQYGLAADDATHAAAKIDSVHGLTNLQALGVTGGVGGSTTVNGLVISNLTDTLQSQTVVTFTMPAGWNTALILAWASWKAYMGSGVAEHFGQMFIGANDSAERELDRDGVDTVIPANMNLSAVVSGNSNIGVRARMGAGDTGTSHAGGIIVTYIAIKVS